jgi:hypothetical protein
MLKICHTNTLPLDTNTTKYNQSLPQMVPGKWQSINLQLLEMIGLLARPN